MRVFLLATLILSLTPRLGTGQELPFTVTIVDWSRESLERQRRAYRSDVGEGEVLYCVESWTKSIAGNGVERIAITSVRRAQSGRDHRIRDIGAQCIGGDGKALPMFHTHSDGNCQFSPSDLVTLVSRAAPFEGVQCGERHFIWTFAWQVLAIATSVEREHLNRAGSSPP
jgi:hypothetical protein